MRRLHSCHKSGTSLICIYISYFCKNHVIRLFCLFNYQIRDFVKEVQNELLKPGFNSFGLGDCKAPKVLGDIVESIAGAIFLDSGCNTAVVWKVSDIHGTNQN